jgi:hypothetical protein
MALASRSDLKDYILSKLGEPVVRVNLANTQIENCIDDALAVYRDYHYDGTEKVYLKHQLTPSNLVSNSVTTGTFTAGETVIGATSNATAKVYAANSTIVQVTMNTASGSFLGASGTGNTYSPGETVTGLVSGATMVLETVRLGDIDLEYITIPDTISAVTGIFQPPSGDISTNQLFSVQYQLIFNDIYNFIQTSMINYTMTKTHLNLVKQIVMGEFLPIRFQRHMSQLHIDWDWSIRAMPGLWLVIECYGVIDPDVYTKVWNDWWLRRYATALCRQQWGWNLLKFEGTALPGNITVNASKIYDEGKNDVKNLEDELQSKFSEPPHFITG